MANKKRNRPYETVIILLLTTILLALVIMIALMLHQMGYLGNLKLPKLPFLEEWGISLPTSDKTDPVPYTEGQVKVCFIDVEQGDSTLIVAPEATVLIDGGTPGQADTIYSLLKEQGIGHLDYVINTHPHADHVGGHAFIKACTKISTLKGLKSFHSFSAWTTNVRYAAFQKV